MSQQEIDHLSLSVWRCGLGWMYAVTARDLGGEQLALGGGTLVGTHRPLTGTDPDGDLRVLLYSIATA